MTTSAVRETLPLGVTPRADGRVSINVWAPAAERVTVHAGGRVVELMRLGRGYHAAIAEGFATGTRYTLRLDGGPDRPDPASRFQPEGPHGPSQVVPREFAWTDQTWRGPALRELVIYELHVGTFTPKGTFDAIIPHLESLQKLGITAIELMPVAQFPGTRNWGYDGVCLFAAQNSYGGPDGLRRLVDAAHGRGMAVILDVVYNHLGPEGNYLREFGPYFTDRYRTPWGRALNFDGEQSDEVRRFFIENALYWVDECHIDALRLDAIHAIADASPVPFVQELCQAVRRRAEALGRRIWCIAESADNNARLITPVERGGFGADAQWNDDFHHALRTTLTDERAGYYQGYRPLEHLHKCFEHGFAFTGEYDPFRKRRHGSPARHIPAERFVVFSQNHDQVGNRMLGERLPALVPFEALKLAAAAVILSPFIPLLFMGEEYGETAPFLYFISHTDEELVEAVRRGRAEEFAAFHATGGPGPPDPQSVETFERSRLDHSLRQRGQHAALWRWYADLLRLRRQSPALAELSKEHLHAARDDRQQTLVVHRWSAASAADPQPVSEALIVFNFMRDEEAGPAAAVVPAGEWMLTADSRDVRYGGPGGGLPARVEKCSVAVPPLTVGVYIRGGYDDGAHGERGAGT